MEEISKEALQAEVEKELPVTQEQIQQEQVDLSKLTPEERARVEELAADIDIQDAQAIVQFGVGAQSNISQFSDSVLNEVRNKDAGEAGEILGELMLKVKNTGVDDFIAKVPVIGKMTAKVKKFLNRFEKTGAEMEAIIDELEKTRMQLLKDITLLDTLYAKNLEYLHDLDLLILAGKYKIQKLKDEVLPVLTKKATESGDPLDAQKLNDFNQMLNRFDKKVHDLVLSRMIAIQTGPQIRLIQNNNQILVEKIQSSILNTIPLWKNQIVIAVSLFRQKKALEQQQQISKTTNDLLKANSELLKTTSVETAREAERGIVELQTLKKVNDDLIQTVEEVIQIQKTGREKRREVEAELQVLEKDLKDRLTSANMD